MKAPSSERPIAWIERAAARRRSSARGARAARAQRARRRARGRDRHAGRDDRVAASRPRRAVARSAERRSRGALSRARAADRADARLAVHRGVRAAPAMAVAERGRPRAVRRGVREAQRHDLCEPLQERRRGHVQDERRERGRGRVRRGVGRAQVQTAIVRPGEADIPLEYLLQQKDGAWRIINIVADGVSDLALKRAEYQRSARGRARSTT